MLPYNYKSAICILIQFIIKASAYSIKVICLNLIKNKNNLHTVWAVHEHEIFSTDHIVQNTLLKTNVNWLLKFLNSFSLSPFPFICIHMINTYTHTHTKKKTKKVIVNELQISKSILSIFRKSSLGKGGGKWTPPAIFVINSSRKMSI